MYKNGYQGLMTNPIVKATYYCDLKAGGCNGVLSTYVTALSMAQQVVNSRAVPFCYTNAGTDCAGIAAVPPVMLGNCEPYFWTNPSTTKPAQLLGLSVANGKCYKLTSSTGKSVYVAVTDRCGGEWEKCFV